MTMGGTLLVCLGAAALLGWYQNIAPLIEIRHGYAAMQFMTATGFLLCGVALLFFLMQLPRLTSLCGVIVGILSLFVCIEYFLKIDLGSNALLLHLPQFPGHMVMKPSPPTSLSFALAGIALMLMGSGIHANIRRQTIRVIGAFILSFCVMALLGYAIGLTGTYAWGKFVGMAVHTAIGFCILSIALFASQCQTPCLKLLARDPWLPVPIGVALITATVVLWYALLDEQYAKITANTLAMAHNLISEDMEQIESRLRELDRIALRWDQQGGTPYAEWKADVTAHIQDEKVFQAIEWVDASLHVRWIVPEEKTTTLVGWDLTKDTRWNIVEALQKSAATKTLTLSPTFELKQGGQGFTAYSPIFSKGKFDGFIVGVFRISNLMDVIFKEAGAVGYTISIFENGQQLYGPPPEKIRSIWVKLQLAESTADLHGHHWRVVVAPTPELIALNTNKLPYIILFLGILLTAALMVAIRALQRARRQSREIARTNRSLQHEITERMQIESQLRTSEERQRVILNSAIGISVIATRPDGIITYFSSGAERLLGYTAAETVGKVTPVIFHDPTELKIRAEELTKEMGRPIDGFAIFITIPELKGFERREWIYLRKDGTRKTVELTVTVSRDANDHIIGYLRTAVDITERKYLEKSLNDTAITLNDRNLLLDKALKEAQSAVQAKSAFLATMSHEIRTPMNGVIGMTTLLSHTLLSDQQNDYVDTIRASGDTLLAIINDILDFSKIESGYMEIERRAFDLRHSVEETVEMMAVAAHNKHLDLVCNFHSDVPAAIMSDSTRIRQVIINLLGNAIKFTETGEVALEITAEPLSEMFGSHPFYRITFSVHDTGIGIPADRMDRLFKSFSQVDASTTRCYGGSGLGLAISKRLAGLLDGDILVESIPGKGSIFRFFMTAPAVPDFATDYVLDRQVALEGKSVIIVDDHETGRAIFSGMTTQWGMETHCFPSVDTALAWVDAGNWPDLVITDMLMPEKDGLDLTISLRKREMTGNRKSLNVILATSEPNSASDPRSADARPSIVLNKPVRQKALLDAIMATFASASSQGITRQRSTQAVPGFAKAYPYRILLVEDNSVNQKVASHLLELLGYSVDIAGDGEEALVACGKVPYDLVFMDIQMPIMDGLTTTLKLRERFKKNNLVIVAMTAAVAPEERNSCLKAGMNDYLSKPLKIEEIKSALIKNAKDTL